MATKKSTAKKSTSTKAKTSAPETPTEDPDSIVIVARPARRADTSGEGRTLDALGNPV